MPSSDFRGTDRFQVQGRIGAGGFGVVYEALDRERGATVALKTLRNVTPEALYRFKREFRSLADISHPNLVQLYELVSADDEWFFTMERIEGRSFLDFVWRKGAWRQAAPAEDEVQATAIIARRPIDDSDSPTGTMASAEEVASSPVWEAPPLADASEAETPTPADLHRLKDSARQLVDGLSALHRARSIHRDIKPSNVMVTPEGRVVLLDFGLVADFAADAMGQSLEIVGTPAYMSPEQAAGVPLSPASDWYSVGVLLFHSLAGRLPFKGGAFEAMQLGDGHELPLPSHFVHGVPESLDVLCRDLLNRDPGRRPGAEEILARLADLAPGHVKTAAAPVRPAEIVVPFVGRARPLAKLRAAFEQASEGTATTICVHGPSGIGKSSLIRAFLDSVRRDYPETVILAGRCYERESVPYKGLDSLIDSLTRHLRRLPEPTIEAILPHHVDALSQLFPVLRRFDRHLSSRRRVPSVPDSQELRRRGFGALRELMVRLADSTPLVLVVDDLQWGDSDSADLLKEVLRSPDAPPLLFVASYRSEETQTSPFLRSFITPEAQAQIHMTDLAVEQLSPDESRELAVALLSSAAPGLMEIAPTIAAEAAGSPFFIDELVRAAEGAGTRQVPLTAAASLVDTAARDATLAQMIQFRLGRLTPEAQRVLQLVAVNGQPIPAPLLKAAAAIDGWETTTAVLTMERLIRTRETGLDDEVETYHDRIRETIVRHLDAETLRAHHRALAIAFESASHPDAELLADHFLASGEPRRAMEYAVHAAETAERALAFDRASRLYQRVVGLLSDESRLGATHERLGNALVNAGRGRDAAAAYLAAARFDTGRAREFQGKAAQQLLFSGHIDEGLSVLNDVLASIGMRLPETRFSTLVALAMGRVRLRLRGLKFVERSEADIAPEALIRVDACFAAAMGLAVVDTIRGVVFQTRHLILALDSGDRHRIVRALVWEAGFTACRGSRTAARTQKLLDLSADLVAVVDTPYARAVHKACVGITAYLNGRWKTSIRFTIEASNLFREQCTGVTHDINNANFFSLWSQFWAGDILAIRSRYPLLLKDAQERGDRYAETMYLVFLSHYFHLAAHEPEVARQTAQGGMRNWSQAGFHLQHTWEMWSLIEVALYEGRGSLAWLTAHRGWAELERSLLLRTQQMLICMVDLRGRSALAAALEATSPSERRRLLHIATRAAARIERQGADWGSALAGLLRAGIAFASHKPTSAQQSLRSVIVEFDRLDMPLMSAVARWRLGELVGGPDGADAVAAADAWMRAQQIARPTRFAAMMAPWGAASPNR